MNWNAPVKQYMNADFRIPRSSLLSLGNCSSAHQNWQITCIKIPWAKENITRNTGWKEEENVVESMTHIYVTHDRDCARLLHSCIIYQAEYRRRRIYKWHIYSL